MLIVLMREDKTLTLTRKQIVYKGESLSDKIMFLVPQTVNSYNIKNCTVSLNILNPNNVGDVKTLTSESTLYSDYLQYFYSIDKNMTAVAGDVELWLSITNTDGVVIKTNSVSFPIDNSKVVEQYIPEQKLTLLDQWQINMTKLLNDTQYLQNQITEQVTLITTKANSVSTSESLAKTSADNAKISETNSKTSETNASTYASETLANKNAIANLMSTFVVLTQSEYNVITKNPNTIYLVG